MRREFKIGEKVIYPKHGAGKVIKIQKENIDGKLREYYKVQFVDSSVIVLVPVKKALELGMRCPMSKSALKKALTNLNKSVKIDKKTLKTLDVVSKERLGSGKTEDVIELINLLRSLAKQKEEENKNFSYSYSDRLEIATNFIKSEISIVLGKGALKRYEI